MGNIFEKEKHINPVVIVLETQAEIDQLYTILNCTPITRMLSDESSWWNEVYTFLQTRRTPAYNNYHEMLEKYLKEEFNIS